MDESMEKKMREIEERARQQSTNSAHMDTDPKPPKENPSIAHLFVGLALFGAGFFMVTQNTTIYSGFTLANFIGFTPPFGVVLLPFLIGVGVLFYNETSIIGWVLTIFGLMTIILGIIMGLRIIFRPISLYEGLIMFGMLFGGAGLTLRYLRQLEL